MGISNVSSLYQRIHNGSEGGNEFARFVKLLLMAEYANHHSGLVAESDASRDFRKLDAFVPEAKPDEKLLTGFQFKFYPGQLSSNQKQDIKRGLSAALDANPGMMEYIVVTPEDWQKGTQEWFDELKKEYERRVTVESDGSWISFNFKLTHWGHTKITELALKHDHVGVHYFPELFPFGAGKFKLASATVDCENSNWYQYDDRPKTDYYQSYPYSRNDLISDPLFDFSFVNSTPEIFLLLRIELHIEEITTQIKGIPIKHLLKSIGVVEYEVDFTKPINIISLPDPVIFEAQKPMRFQVLLKNFTKKCPGNCAKIKFWFRFNNYSLPTESFYLSF